MTKMLLSILLSAAALSAAPQALSTPTAQATAPAATTSRATARAPRTSTVVLPPRVSPTGQPLPSNGTIANAVGGTTTQSGIPNVLLTQSPRPGVYEIVLNDTGTGWQEKFLIGVPSVPVQPEAPLLVAFHGWGNTHNSILAQTSYFDEARERGWYVCAPLGAHKYNFAIPYAQQNVQAALEWVTNYLPIDDSRIYGVGFSMGGGNVANYAARHLDPNRPRFAAIANHTGTVSLRDVYYNSIDPDLLEHVSMFDGTPTDRPFEYARSSVIDMAPGDLEPDADRDLARNLVGLPQFHFAAANDPLSHLVGETRILSRWLWRLGATPRFKLVPGTEHTWESLDEWSVCEFFSQHTLDADPQGTHELLADRDAKYYCFDVEQDSADDFTPFRWNLSSPQNRLVLDQTENLARLRVDTQAAGLDTNSLLKVMFGTQDGEPEEVVLDGYDFAPSVVLRNGVTQVPGADWDYDATTGTVTLYEADATNYPLWFVKP